MKKISRAFVFNAFFLLLMSCNGSSNKVVKTEETLEKAISNSQQSKIIENKIFLGFRFGMTEKQVISHLDSLVSSKKVYRNEEGAYQYDFITDSGLILKTTFNADYHKGELYKMVYLMRGDLTAKYAAMVAHTFHKTGYKGFIKDDALGDTKFTYVKDNIIVYFDNPAFTEMVYENSPISKLVEEERKVELEKKVNSTKSDF